MSTSRDVSDQTFPVSKCSPPQLSHVNVNRVRGRTGNEAIPTVHEGFHELKVFHETFISTKSKAYRSSGSGAYWAGVGGNISFSKDLLRIGVVQ